MTLYQVVHPPRDRSPLRHSRRVAGVPVRRALQFVGSPMPRTLPLPNHPPQQPRIPHDHPPNLAHGHASSSNPPLVSVTAAQNPHHVPRRKPAVYRYVARHPNYPPMRTANKSSRNQPFLHHHVENHKNSQCHFKQRKMSPTVHGAVMPPPVRPRRQLYHAPRRSCTPPNQYLFLLH